MRSRRRSVSTESGFTLVELMVVVLVLGVLVLLAIPIYASARGNAEKRTCFMNQNTLQRAAEAYLALHKDAQRSDLAGIVNDTHPVRVENIVGATPRCPAGERPADPGNPTVSEGAYRFDASGSVMPCTLGTLGAHGSFTD